MDLFRRYSDRGGLQHGMLRNNIFQWRVNFTFSVIFSVCRPTTGRFLHPENERLNLEIIVQNLSFTYVVLNSFFGS